MGIIRKQSIASSIVIYAGFAIGALNTWFFLSKYFTPEQYGLTRVFFDIGQTFFALANLGSLPIMYRFYPYYRDRLPLGKRDLFARMLLLSLVGFFLVCVASLVFKDMIVRKFSTNSPLLVTYFYAIYPFTFFLLLFSLLEAQAWNHFSSVAANFFKELVLRVYTTFIILLFILHWLDFDQFVIAFSMAYAVIALGLLIYLLKKHQVSFVLKGSVITRRMYKKMIPFGIFVFLVSLSTILGKTFETILISSVLGLAHTGVYTFASYLTTTLEAPQRGLVSISVPIIAQAWKEKDLARISRIYQRSSVNMLLFSGFLFALIWLNLHNAFIIFHINPEYMKGETVLLLLGFKTIIELGTGVNTQIIGTSRYWRIDFLTNMVLIFILIPLNYVLVKRYGINGSALATLIAYLIFNLIRFIFIWVKFGMQPFTWRTLAAIGTLLASYLVAHYLVHAEDHLLEAVLQSVVYVVLSAVFIIKMRVSEDVQHFMEMAFSKLRRFRG